MESLAVEEVLRLAAAHPAGTVAVITPNLDGRGICGKTLGLEARWTSRLRDRRTSTFSASGP